ncbi:hypothetical protein M2146_001130 [Lachnospiraceae bacterium PF1-22]
MIDIEKDIKEMETEELCNYCKHSSRGCRGLIATPNGPLYPPCSEGLDISYFETEKYIKDLDLKWSVLIDFKRKEIEEQCLKAYEEALRNKHLKFTVQLENDSSVYYWHQIAGDNSFKESELTGDSVVIASYCFQGCCSEESEDDFRIAADELKRSNAISEIEAAIEKEDEDFLTYAINQDKYTDIFERMKKNVIEAEMREWAPTKVEADIDMCLSRSLYLESE